MLKGLALTPPVIGRISIGKVEEKNGKYVPVKDDEFTITTQVQKHGKWIPHPINEQLRKANEKLRSIPVMLLFDDPDLNLRAQYSLFDRQTGRPICVGNGESCKRTTPEGVKSEYCPSPNSCPIGANGQCKPYGRLNVRIGEDDEVGSFIFRTTGFNSIRTLASRLHYFSALSGKKLSTLPLELKLRSKSTTMSFRTPIYYVDLVIREGMTLNQAIHEAHKTYEERIQAGFKQEALDEAARNGFAAGAFEENEEDGVAIVEEFYPEKTAISVREGSQSAITLAEKIAEKAANT